jgi:hypothetical protein
MLRFDALYSGRVSGRSQIQQSSDKSHRWAPGAGVPAMPTEIQIPITILLIDDDGWSITRLHTPRDETTDPHEWGGSAVLRSHFDVLRRGRSTNSAASSASLRSVLRGAPICARMVSPRAKSVT